MNLISLVAVTVDISADTILPGNIDLYFLILLDIFELQTTVLLGH